MDEGYGKLSQLQQGQTVQKAKEADLYDRHRQSVIEFHKACKEFARASQLRDQASAILQQATEELGKQIQVSLLDPTVPQQAAPPNGGFGQSAATTNRLSGY